MQHDLFQSGHDLDLRSNFQHDLLRSNHNSFDASYGVFKHSLLRFVVNLKTATVFDTSLHVFSAHSVNFVLF